MTIVLQHQFWDLDVGEDAFEIGLSFGGVPEKLVVPFSAIKGFFDPSVQFGLQFETVTEGASVSRHRRERSGRCRDDSRSPPPRRAGPLPEPEEMPKAPAARAKKKDAEAATKKSAKETGENAGAQGGRASRQSRQSSARNK